MSKIHVKYKDKIIVDITPTSNSTPNTSTSPNSNDLTSPKFDTINQRFTKYDLFGGKYDPIEVSGDRIQNPSLFRSRYNSIVDELANTPYAFKTNLIEKIDSQEIEDNRYFNKSKNAENEEILFGQSIDYDVLKSISSDEELNNFSIKHLIHAQNRYFDLSTRNTSDLSVNSVVPVSTLNSNVRDGASDVKSSFKVLPEINQKKIEVETNIDLASSRGEHSFTIISETPVTTRPSTPKFGHTTSSRTESPSRSSTTSRNQSPNRTTDIKGPSSRKNTFTTVDNSVRISKSSTSTESPRRKSSVLINTASFKVESPTLSRNKLSEHSVKVLNRNLSPVRKTTLSRAQSADRKPILSKAGSPERNTRNQSPGRKSVTLSNLTDVKSSLLKNKTKETNYLTKSLNRTDQFVDEQITKKSNWRNRSNSSSRSLSPNRRNSSLTRTGGISGVSTRASSPSRRTSSLSRLENMAQVAFIHPTINLSRPVSPKNFIEENIKEIHEISEVNREKHQAELDRIRREEEEQILKEMGVIKSANSSRCSSPGKSLRSRSHSPSAILHYEEIDAKSSDFVNVDELPKPGVHKSRKPKSQPQSNNASPKHTKIPKRQASVSPARKPVNGLNKPNRAISNSTSNINHIHSKTPDKKRPVSKSSQNINITPPRIRAKPPPTPKTGPPPVNKNLNAKRLSPIAGTPNKSPVDTKTTTKPAPVSSILKATGKKTIKSVPTPNSVKAQNGEASPEKKKPINRTASTKRDILVKKVDTPQKSSILSKTNGPSKTETAQAQTKPDLKKLITKANSVKAIARTSSSKSIVDKKEDLKKSDSKSNLIEKKSENSEHNDKTNEKPKENGQVEYEKIKDSEKPNKDKPIVKKIVQKIDSSDEVVVKNSKNDLVPLTKKNVVSMTTAAITAQPLEVVTNITRQLPSVTDKTKENHRLEKKDSTNSVKYEKNGLPTNGLVENLKNKFENLEKDALKINSDDKNSIHDTAKLVTAKITDATKLADNLKKETEKDYHKEATEIVNSILTPVETPKLIDKVKENIEPSVIVVNERKNIEDSSIKVNQSLVKGEGDVEVQSSNSSPNENRTDDASMRSVSNGGTKYTNGIASNGSTSPVKVSDATTVNKDVTVANDKDAKTSKLCQMLICGGCQNIPCCKKSKMAPADGTGNLDLNLLKADEEVKGKQGLIAKFKRTKNEQIIQNMTEKSTFQVVNESSRTKPSRLSKFCLCCKRNNRVSDSATPMLENKRTCMDLLCCRSSRTPVQELRRDSILSERKPIRWYHRVLPCLKPKEPEVSRRPSIFSKNKSLSPPPEDTRPKLDPSLVEHMSVMKAAIPVLPLGLAYICLTLNIIIPGLGTILSGIFCLCFGKPRFGIHDGVKHRIGSFVINLFIGVGQLFTILFCLVGWGWSIWWGVIMLKLAKKYRRLKHAEKLDAERRHSNTNNHGPSV